MRPDLRELACDTAISERARLVYLETIGDPKLSVGIESPKDILADLDQALRQA